jgi:hypothetical protein
MNRNSYVILFFFCYLLLGCKKEHDCVPVSSHRTVLVYLGVDNNFRHEAEEKIETLTSNWDRSIDGNLFVYADAGEKPVLVHIYYTKRRGVVADTIEIYTAENSASPAVFTRVLNKVKAYRPAASYGLVVLSHGSGWLPAEMSSPIRLKSVILDTGVKDATYMELADFAEAIPYKLDFIIFDVCFMGSVEVAYELKGKADYIVASPAEVLAPGFVYSTMMRHLFKPQPDLTAVAREFYEYYNELTGNYRSATVSVVNTSKLDGLIPIVKEITAEANLSAEDFNSIQTFGFGTQKIYFDMGDYLQKIAPEKQEKIEAAIAQCVPYKACTPSYYSAATNKLQEINAFSGLSVYIPQAAYPEANRAYGNLKWNNRIIE